jgi:hypothetical protein
MERLPAISGGLWIRDGFALWRRQPNELSLVFMLYVALNLAIAVIPFIGPIMVLLLGPMLTTAFMSTCAQVDAGGHAHPRQLFAYFRRPVFGRLMLLGFCYVLACLLGSVIMSSFAGPDIIEAAMKNNSASVAMEPAVALKAMEAVALGSGAYLLLAMPLWFAAPLIAWQEMGFAKAVFFSFFSALRAYKSFVVYLLAWILINLLVVINVGAILSLLPVNSTAAGMALLIPCLLVLTMIRYCSYYSSYVQVFGKPAITPPG